MAHPVRAGYFAEHECRMLAMYGAYYANDLKDVVAFCEREKIDWFIVDRTRFSAVEKGDGQLFEPVRSKVVALFDARKAQGFAMAKLPREVTAYHHGDYDVVEVARLREHVQRSQTTPSPP